MSFLTTLNLRQELKQAIRSAGLGGLTTAQDVRTYLGHLLDELDAAEAAQAAKADLGPDGRVLPAQLPPALDPANLVHRTGDEGIAGVKTFTGDVLLGNGQDGSGLKVRRPSGEGYQRLLDVTNVDRPNSINFGAVGDGGDLRYHGAAHRWLANGGGATRMLLDDQSALTVAGPVRATAFVGDGSQLTSLPAAPRCSATNPAVGQLIGDPNGAPTTVRFGTATGTGYDVATGRYASGRAGLHVFTVGLAVDNTSVGGELYIGLLINGSRNVILQHWQHARVGVGGGVGYAEVELGANDYVEVGFKHDNGRQPFQVLPDYYYTFFTGRWVSA